jgi:hypothetical protein
LRLQRYDGDYRWHLVQAVTIRDEAEHDGLLSGTALTIESTTKAARKEPPDRRSPQHHPGEHYPDCFLPSIAMGASPLSTARLSRSGSVSERSTEQIIWDEFPRRSAGLCSSS